MLAAGISNIAVCAKKHHNDRPNILFILSDDHTSQTWGIYGGHLADYAKTDNIRRLAAEGVTLDNCFATNSISTPSRACIFTGRYAHKNGVYTLSDTLDTSLPTIAKTLQKAGYQTALVGKWHLGSQPQGFDYYSVFHDQGEYRDPTFQDSDRPWPGNINYGMRVHGFSTDLVTDKTIAWIKDHKDNDAPFMMCCHFKATHEPYDFPERMRHLYDGVVFPEPENMMDKGPNRMAVNSEVSHWRRLLAVGLLHRPILTNGGAATLSCLFQSRACRRLLHARPYIRN